MIPRITQFMRFLKTVEHNISQLFGHPPQEFALAYVHNPTPPQPAKKFSLQDLIGDGFLLAVPKSRRTVEKRLKRKFGDPKYFYKPIQENKNILMCLDCGHHYEAGRLCANCYKKVQEETKAIQENIQEKLGNKPIEHDVIVLYEGENLPEKAQEFWKGKRVIEMKKERPRFFSKNLLQKTTQQPSTATDVKPTDLA